MLSKSRLRLIRSLDTRKGRRASGLFVAEGPKLVSELMCYLKCNFLLLSSEWAADNRDAYIRLCRNSDAEVELVKPAELERASFLQTPQGVLALFEIPSYHVDPVQAMTSSLNLALDGVQDPGNIGTIVRLADWFGVKDIWCSESTADVWSPKAVQASMGGLARVRVHYINLCETLRSLPQSAPCVATALDGEPLWQSQLPQHGVIVMGNEGRGVTREVATACRHKLLIPSFPPGAATTESLNVGVATAIILAEFRRQALAVQR